jgi:hypothetical protein
MENTKEYKGPGSVHAIFKWYAKQELDASGAKPDCLSQVEVEDKKIKQENKTRK